MVILYWAHIHSVQPHTSAIVIPLAIGRGIVRWNSPELILVTKLDAYSLNSHAGNGSTLIWRPGGIWDLGASPELPAIEASSIIPLLGSGPTNR